MKLATIRTSGGTTAVRVEGEEFVDLGVASVSELLRDPNWAVVAAAEGPRISAEGVEYAALTPTPGKVICAGLNYRAHIEEVGQEIPQYPTLFVKFPEALVGPYDEVVLPPEDDQYDWEVELVVVIGKPVRRATGAEAEEAIAGFTILNDVSMRGWQMRTGEWLQGKAWANTTPIGPVLVTPDEVGGVRPALQVSCAINGETKQSDSTGDLVFDPVALVEYISTFTPLAPGDVIATGTCGGVGLASGTFMKPGDTITTEIEGIGRLENVTVAEQV